LETRLNQIVIDYETRSEADLNKVGGVKYAQHPSTEIICLGYKINNQPAKVWVPSREPFPKDLMACARDESFIWIAHSALFEQVITKYVLKVLPDLPPSRWKCTAAKAAVCALPRNLEGAALALNLAVKKDMVGSRLIKKYMKPRRRWIEWSGSGRSDPEPEKYFNNDFELWDIYKYCKTDVEAEFLLDKALPDLIPLERDVWILNQEMNLRGVQIDLETVRLILKLIHKQNRTLVSELTRITKGAVTTANQRDRILAWLNNEGLPIKSLAALTVKETLDSLSETKFKDKPVERVLEIRQTLSMSSTKKYIAMTTRASDDGKVRDLALYHGAHTGRESGTGIQIHNLPKGKIKNTNRAIEVVKTGDMDFIEALYGKPLAVFSACIRGMITASPKHKLFVADFNAIECRVLNWIAGTEHVLNDFREGKDPYLKMAAKVGSDDRQLGKTIELASGYQMGANKLFETCIAWGVNGGSGISMELAEKGIKAYRESHKPVVDLWSLQEKAAINVVKKPHTAVKSKGLVWGVTGKFLWCQLPSGRKLYYYAPTVRLEPTPWGDLRPKLYHWGVDSLTKKWMCKATYGGKIVENIVQGIARDLTMYSALLCEKKGYIYLFQVHDELVSESKRGSVSEFENILTTLPRWAEGLPIAAKGWTDFRYAKR
jgi:DNA polymerase bacteriophage-type